MLITYKNKRLFRFREIPYSIKQLILEKCLEKSAGIYNFIPKFKRLKESVLPPAPPDKDDDSEQSKSPSTGIEVTVDPTTVFQFYSKSSDKPLPGKGSGETIKPENEQKFADLAALKGWRRVLSNFYVSPFELDGYRWKAVEMFYQASKFKKSHPQFYTTFAMDSGNEISKNAAMAKAMGGATGKFKGVSLRPKHIKIDDDYFSSGRAKEAMMRAQKAKYTQNNHAKEVLLATKDAKLQHYSRGQAAIIFTDTMQIREQLQEKSRIKKK